MVKFIAESIIEYKIERWVDKRNRALALGKDDEVWKLTTKIENARNRMMSWSFCTF